MSVFTFDPDPPRVSSPWLRSEPGTKTPSPDRSTSCGRGPAGFGLLSDYGISKLEPEPQDGPTEYKLHLLLRPRRKYERLSTTTRISGSTQSRPSPDPKTPKPASISPSPQSASSSQTRQDRLEHLTTQLLWRLQQSCPYHAGSAAPKLVIPQLPDESITLEAPLKLGKLLPGLEASRGALYEIGVADDGTLVGLTKDEMDESITTLRIMAASLGCNVEVLRMLIVGDCEWVEPSNPNESSSGSTSEGVIHKAKLWVAEALVTPNLRPRGEHQAALISARSSETARMTETFLDPKQEPLTTNQLRVTLTGPTTSGKSTLLGVLSTGTLDNGRGKSRLGLLKHLHEVASGVTSSVTQELVGYTNAEVINYGHRAVESWIDIHDFTKDGRLVYLVDSAGHPRYRRTILRGIVGWAPHWTLMCIAADNSELTSTIRGGPHPPEAAPGVDLASAHLDLCLRLRLPLVIVITKLDLATKPSLSFVLNRILSDVKKSGRVPKVVKGSQTSSPDLGRVSQDDIRAVKEALACIDTAGDLTSIVPIVLTSAVDGRGLGSLHALLQHLPLPPTPTSLDYIGTALNPEQPASLFHIEDKFSLPASSALATLDSDKATDIGTVVAGYLRFGTLSIGDKVVVGPFPSNEDHIHGEWGLPDGRHGSSSYLSASHPSSSAAVARASTSRNTLAASAANSEWYTASIVSIRNLRLPVQTLTAGQVGSIGIVFDPHPQITAQSAATLPSIKQHSSSRTVGGSAPRLRKGMVLAIPSRHMVSSGLTLQAASGLIAVFDKDNRDACRLTVGELVNIYVASVRATARVLRVSKVSPHAPSGAMNDGESGGSRFFGIEEVHEEGHATDASGPETDGAVEVQLALMSNREWIELGSKILVLEERKRDKSGLEGYVGKVIEIVE